MLHGNDLLLAEKAVMPGRCAIKTFPRTATKQTAVVLREIAAIWSVEGRNADAARALIFRAEALEK